MFKELWYTLIDILRYGDVRGHLRAWWEVATGRVTPDDTRIAIVEKWNSSPPLRSI